MGWGLGVSLAMLSNASNGAHLRKATIPIRKKTKGVQLTIGRSKSGGESIPRSTAENIQLGC